MPPLHEALVEVHKEYAKASRAAKDMADLYKKATTAVEMLNVQCTASQAENQRLSKQVRLIEELLKKTRKCCNKQQRAGRKNLNRNGTEISTGQGCTQADRS